MKRNPRHHHRLSGVLLSGVLASSVALAADSPVEQRSTVDDQLEVAVTIYNGDLALVRDRRRVRLEAGTDALAYRDVSAQIRPETAMLRSVSHPDGLQVLEQNFDFDLLTPQKLLEKYVGAKVGVVKTHPTTGEETEEEAVVLSANDGVVLRIGDRIETGLPGRIVFRDVPPSLRDRPTLVMQLQNRTPVEQQLELSYLTGGLSWQADYVGELSAADDQLDLGGWVTLTNASGTPYANARLQLVAGDVNRVQQEFQGMRAREGVLAMAAVPAPQMAEESLFEYHLYTLNRPTTIADRQTKQVSLLTASAVPVSKEYVLQGRDYYYRSSFGDLGQKLKLGVFVEFINDEQSRLGIPLPKGVVRIYKRDSDGNVQFVGEDHIDHTPKNEKLRLKLGEAFDVTADKKQTDYKKRSGFGPFQFEYESAYAILLKNAKPELITVTVQEPVPGDWTITEESLPHTKGAANTAVWQVPVPAEGEATLSYRVRVRL